MFRIIDLSHTIEEGMPVFPGDSRPRLCPETEWEREGYRESGLFLGTHTGTHVDAPFHIFPQGPSVEELAAERFFGPALMIDCRFLWGERREGDTAPRNIPLSVLEPVREAAEAADFLVFYTGWEERWGREDYFNGYPVPSVELCGWLAASGKKGIGLDTPSADPAEEGALPRHKRLLAGTGMAVLENLTGLGSLGQERFFLIALPLKVKGADGSPVRAAALIWEGTDGWS